MLEFLFFITFLVTGRISSAEEKRTEVTLNFKMSGQKGCSEFLQGLTNCKPNYCSVDLDIDGKTMRLSLKTIASAEPQNKCKIFVSKKMSTSTEVALLELNQKYKESIKEILNQLLTKKIVIFKNIENCCLQNPKAKEINCPANINGKAILGVLNFTAYYDCKGNPIFPIKKKIIEYKE